MADLLLHTFPGSAALSPPFVHQSGPVFTEAGGLADSADPTQQSRVYIDLAAGTLASAFEFDFSFRSSSCTAVLELCRQASGLRYACYVLSSGYLQFFTTSNGTDYTPVGAQTTASAVIAPGHQRVRLEVLDTDSGSNTLRANWWSSAQLSDLGTGPALVLTNFTRPDSAKTIALPGKAGFFTQQVTLRRIRYSDDAVAPSGVVSGNAIFEMIVSGALASVLPGSIVTLPFSRNPGNGARPVALANNAIAVLTDDANLARVAGASGLLMGNDGRLTLANAVPLPVGTSVVVVTREADGKLGVERYSVS